VDKVTGRLLLIN